MPKKMKGAMAFVGFKKEATYGTRVAGTPTDMIKILSESVGFENPQEFDGSLGGGSIYRTNPTQGLKKVGGDISSILHFEGFEMLFYNLLGSGIAPTVVSNSGQWLWKVATDGSLPVGFTSHIERDIKKWVYTGCKVKSVEIKYAAGKPLEVTWGILGKDLNAVEAVDSSSFKAYSPILASYGAVTIDSTSRCAMIKEATIKFDNVLSEDMYSVCSDTIVETDRSGLVKAGGELTCWVDTDILTALHDKFKTGGTFGIVLTHTGGAIPGSSPSVNYLFKVEAPYCVITPTGDPQVSGEALVECKFPFEIYNGGASEPFQVTCYNSRLTTL